jgi:hypothetical protein
MAELTRREPPDRQGGRKSGEPYAYEDEAAQLRAEPGVWKLLTEFPAQRAVAARNLGVNIRTGRLRVFQPGGSFDARTATERNDANEPVVNVYAVYLGDDAR